MKEEKKKSKQKSMNKLRERIRNDPVLHEEAKRKARERYRAKKEAGKVRFISDMGEREKRALREGWRKRSKKSYEARKAQGKIVLKRQEQRITQPSAPTLEENYQENFIEDENDAARRNIIILQTRIEQLEEELKLVNMKKQKYEKIITRLKKQIKNSPQTPINNF